MLVGTYLGNFNSTAYAGEKDELRVDSFRNAQYEKFKKTDKEKLPEWAQGKWFARTRSKP